MTKRIDKQQLTAAMSTPDPDVGVPSRQKAGSLTAQVAALDIGECASKASPVDTRLTLADYVLNGAEMREAIRNSVKSSVRLASSRTGGKYDTEVSDMITTGGRLYIVAVVTRTE